MMIREVPLAAKSLAEGVSGRGAGDGPRVSDGVVPGGEVALLLVAG